MFHLFESAPDRRDGAQSPDENMVPDLCPRVAGSAGPGPRCVKPTSPLLALVTSAGLLPASPPCPVQSLGGVQLHCGFSTLQWIYWDTQYFQTREPGISKPGAQLPQPLPVPSRVGTRQQEAGSRSPTPRGSFGHVLRGCAPTTVHPGSRPALPVRSSQPPPFPTSQSADMDTHPPVPVPGPLRDLNDLRISLKPRVAPPTLSDAARNRAGFWCRVYWDRFSMCHLGTPALNRGRSLAHAGWLRPGSCCSPHP